MPNPREGNNARGFNDLGDMIHANVDLMRGAVERSEKAVETSTALVAEMKREATVVGDLKAQLEQAQAQLREAHEANAAMQQWRTEKEAEFVDIKARFKELDAGLKGDEKTWIPRGVDPAEKERLLAIRHLGEYSVDVGMKRFQGREQFGWLERSGQSEGTTTEGGNLIALPVLQEVAYIRPTYGLIRAKAFVQQMTGPKLDIPWNTDEPLVYYVNEKQLPAGESNVPLGDPNRNITVKTLTAYDIMSLEFLSDVPDAIVNFIGERFLLAISGEEDRVGLVASNNPTGWFGIMHGTAKGVGNVVMSGNSFELLTRKDLVNLTRGVDDDDAENGEFVFSRYGLGVIEGLQGTGSGLPLFNSLDMGPKATLLGYPWNTHRKMPKFADDGASKPFMIFGNLKRLFFGDLQQVEVKWSSEASFFNGAMVLRMRERFGTELVRGDGLARLVTHS